MVFVHVPLKATKTLPNLDGTKRKHILRTWKFKNPFRNYIRTQCITMACIGYFRI